MKMLNVPYKSQWDTDAKGTNNDCGPCSCAMVMGYFGKIVTTDEVFAETGAGQGVISFPQLQHAVQHFNFKLTGSAYKTLDDLKALIDKSIPAIVALHYGLLPTKQDSYAGGHILVVRGYDDSYIYTNDPDWSGSRRDEGNNKKYPIEDFDKAWASLLDGNNPRNLWYIEPPTGWSPDDCKAEIEKWQTKATYEEGEKEKYKKEARALRPLADQVVELKEKVKELESYKSEADELRPLKSEVETLATQVKKATDLAGEWEVKYHDVDNLAKNRLSKIEKELNPTINTLTEQNKLLQAKLDGKKWGRSEAFAIFWNALFPKKESDSGIDTSVDSSVPTTDTEEVDKNGN